MPPIGVAAGSTNVTDARQLVDAARGVASHDLKLLYDAGVCEAESALHVPLGEA